MPMRTTPARRLSCKAYRGRQIMNLRKPPRPRLQVSDEQLERSMRNQFKRMQDSGIDRLLFSPQASAMGASLWLRTGQPLLDGGLQRPDCAPRPPLSGQSLASVSATPVAGREPPRAG